MNGAPITIYNWNELDEPARERVLARPALDDDAAIQASVEHIVARVRDEGDSAIRDLTRRFDGVDVESLAVSDVELEAAAQSLSAAERDAIESAASNIESFHAAQRPAAVEVETAPGVLCERVTRPIRSVGLYVPAGGAPLPSTALMLGIPARIAGCPVTVMCSPAQKDGRASPAVLYAARVAGIQRVFKAGGAQAIAALAYGTQTIPKVDKIFGPGNAWVTAAKSLVARDPRGAALDLPAGPSEVLVIGDDSANADFVASDLLSQAEHGPDSQVMLISTSRQLADSVAHAIERMRSKLRRADTIERSLAGSCIVLVPDIETAVELANAYAPEHLILQVETPRHWVARIYTAGSVFLGPWTPESLGDYCSGTNHVLPTYGFARAYSGLGVSDYLRSMTIQEATQRGLGAIGPTAATLASLEGLDAHAEAVASRLRALDPKDAP